MTTIDNETQVDVTAEEIKQRQEEAYAKDMPALLLDDESTIRSTFKKFVDGVVSLSSYARQVDMLEAKMAALEKTIEEANARVLEANAARDTARAEADVAKTSAKMAREAYIVVDVALKAANDKLEMYSAEIDELKQSESILQGRLAKEEETHRLTADLLRIATDERGFFRAELETMRNKWEDEQLKNMEFEDTKEKLATTEEALSICAGNVAKARSEASEGRALIESLTQECKGLHTKVNGLEDDNKRQGDQILALQTKINNASMHLH